MAALAEDKAVSLAYWQQRLLRLRKVHQTHATQSRTPEVIPRYVNKNLKALMIWTRADLDHELLIIRSYTLRVASGRLSGVPHVKVGRTGESRLASSCAQGVSNRIQATRWNTWHILMLKWANEFRIKCCIGLNLTRSRIYEKLGQWQLRSLQCLEYGSICEEAAL